MCSRLGKRRDTRLLLMYWVSIMARSFRTKPAQIADPCGFGQYKILFERHLRQVLSITDCERAIPRTSSMRYFATLRTAQCVDPGTRNVGYCQFARKCLSMPNRFFTDLFSVLCFINNVGTDAFKSNSASHTITFSCSRKGTSDDCGIVYSAN
jgi:hypothetical protein